MFCCVFLGTVSGVPEVSLSVPCQAGPACAGFQGRRSHGLTQPFTASQFWRLESETQAWAGLVSPGRADAVPFLCPHGTPSVGVCVLTSSSSKGAGQIGSEATVVTSFYLNHLHKNPISKYSHLPKSWGFPGVQHMRLDEKQLSS